MNKTKIALIATFVAILAALSWDRSFDQEKGAPYELIAPFNSYVTVYDNNNVEPMRPDIFGTHGVVSTGNYLSTLAGIEVLKKGGNACDAGVAAAMALKVTAFDLSGWAGVAPLIFYSARPWAATQREQDSTRIRGLRIPRALRPCGFDSRLRHSF